MPTESGMAKVINAAKIPVVSVISPITPWNSIIESVYGNSGRKGQEAPVNVRRDSLPCGNVHAEDPTPIGSPEIRSLERDHF